MTPGLNFVAAMKQRDSNFNRNWFESFPVWFQSNQLLENWSGSLSLAKNKERGFEDLNFGLDMR